MAVDSANRQSLATRLGDSQVAARTDLEISRHVFLGETSYVVRDPISFEGHRFSPADYEIFSSLRDDITLAETLENLVEAGSVQSEQEDDFYRFVVELQKRGLLNLPVTDSETLYQQFERRRQARSGNLLMKLLFLRVPLGSPDHFLKSTWHLVRGVFTRTFFTIWLIGLIAAVLTIAFQWQEFTSQLASALAVRNLPLILLVMSLLKLWHELGHGYACRHFGVTVPSAGLLLMVGTPLAFVDASGSWALRRRRDRQIINLAGIYFEMMIAIVAAFVWTLASDASVRSLAHFTLVVSSITTVAFNINPLMKYDGYYVLTDMIGIPNLKSRAAFQIQSLAKKLFFRLPVPQQESAVLNVILLVYGVASSLYKLVLVLAISLLIANSIWIVGLAIAGYYLTVSLGAMIWKGVRFLCFSEQIASQRRLAMTYLVILAASATAILVFCPVPGGVVARGLVEHRTLKVVHSPHHGFLSHPAVAAGHRVEPGDRLASIENVERLAAWERLQAELRQLKLRRRAYQGVDPGKMAQVAWEIERVRYELEQSEVQSQLTPVVAPLKGQVLNGAFAKRQGAYIERGDEICRIGDDGFVVRAVIDAKSLADIKPSVGQTVHCRCPANPSAVIEGRIRELSVSGSRMVPQEALTHLAGGNIPVDAESMMATEAFFDLLIELEPAQETDFLRHGLVCEIRFRRTYQSVGELVYRAILRFANKVNLK